MREFKIGDEVTLVEALEGDNGFKATEDMVGEIVDTIEDRYVVAFQDLVDDEGATPAMILDEDEFELLF